MLLLLTLAPAAGAEVLVYSGKVQRLMTNDIPPLQTRKTYLVLDQIQRKFCVLSWGKDVIGKRHDFPIIDNLDYFVFPRSDGKIEDGYAVAQATRTFNDLSGGAYAGIFLHGVRVPVTISVIGDVKNVQDRAKALVGTNAAGATTILGPLYRFDAFNVKLNEKETIAANGFGSTIDAVVAHLVGVVESMGYVSK